jgi:MoxR-like ATPase
LFADSERIARRMSDVLGGLGFRIERVQFGCQSENRMEFGGASHFARQLTHWLLQQEGLRLSERKIWADDDHDMWLYVRDPELIQLPDRERFPVRVLSDDPSFANHVMDRLKGLGFRPELPCSTPSGRFDRFYTEPGPLSLTSDGADSAALHDAVRRLLDEHGIDSTRYPLEKEDPDPEHRPRRLLAEAAALASGCSLGAAALVCLPVATAKDGSLRPYAGSFPARFNVAIRTDDPAVGNEIGTKLEQLGYRQIELMGFAGSHGVSGLKVGAQAPHWEEVATSIRNVVGGVLGRTLTAEDLPAIPGPAGSSCVELCLATKFDADEAQRAVESLRSKHPITLSIPSRAWGELFKAAPELAGFLEVRIRDRRSGDFRIDYGSASAAVIRPLSRWIESMTGTAPELCMRWNSADDDIYVTLPQGLAKRAATHLGQNAATRESILQLGGKTGSKHYHGPFLQRSDDTLRLGSVELPVRHPHASRHVPRRSSLGAFCLDQTVANTLHHVAMSVSSSEPCLLEGDTATSKTSCILYLASQLNQPVVRLNLHGQTDTSELVGRYVPSTDGDGRTGWRWQQGLVVQAMLEGWWLVLDELNLAEPHVLERLNSVLERCPSLVLTEHDGAVIGSEEAPVHQAFRVFGTMNPSTYEGRNVLSPAFLDRWTGYCRVAAPGEREISETLRHWKTGEQPSVVLDGVVYQPWVESVAPSALDRVPDPTLEAFARFHAAAARRFHEESERGGFGAAEVTLTRRLLDRATAFLAARLAQGAEDAVATMLERYYFARCRTAEARENLGQLAVATGLAGSTGSDAPPASGDRPDLDWLPDDAFEPLEEMAV